MHTLTHAHTHACTHSRMHTLTHAHTHACTHSRMHTLTHAHTHACTHSRMHTLTHAHTHACTHSRMHTLTHAHTHTCTHSHMHTHCTDSIAVLRNGFGQGSLPVFLSSTNCGGDEDVLTQCEATGPGAFCQYDAGVICSGELRCLVDWRGGENHHHGFPYNHSPVLKTDRSLFSS